MLTIRKRIGLFALLIVFGASASAPVLAQADTTHKYTSKLKSAPVKTANGYPNPGGTALLAGSVKIKPTKLFGAGAVIDRVTVTDRPEPNVFAFKGKERDFYAHGMVRNKIRGTVTVQGDGSQEVTGKGRFTGGTGRYRGASGHYRFSGTVAPGSTVLIGGSRGKISF